MKKNIIIGASSSIGKNFISRFSLNTIFTYNNNPIKNGIKFDIINQKIEDLVDLNNIDNVVIMTAITDPKKCFENIKLSENVNVIKMYELIKTLVENKVKIFFISSEYIYDGKKGNYSESDIPLPILVYGKQKLKIEKKIKLLTDNYCIIRLPKTYGLRDNAFGFFNEWLNKIKSNDLEFTCAYDQNFSPLFVDDLSKILDILIKIDFVGTINVGGPQDHSRIDCLEILLKILNIKNFSINKISLNDLNHKEILPLDVSFNIKFLLSIIDFKLSFFEESIKKYQIK